jgi:3-hydroxybutyryl-CoA dehydrogenase
MNYQVIQAGESRSFPEQHAFTEASDASAKNIVYVGGTAAQAYKQSTPSGEAADFVAIELGMECLGVHIGDEAGPDNVLGFARFRLGDAAPTNLIELVYKTYTNVNAVQHAKTAFESAGFKVALCGDFPGRIVNRLVRPYYNAALRRLDEGLASANDMDMTLRLGLGYPEGPIALLNKTGLHHHFEVTQDLYEQIGQEAYAPARRARIAWLREQNSSQDKNDATP